MKKTFTNERDLLDAALKIAEQRFPTYTNQHITDDRSAAQVARLCYASNELSLEIEHFGVIFLNSRNTVIKTIIMFTGTVNSCQSYPRDVAREALNCNAVALILFHNHPSDAAEPNKSDISITRKIKNATKLFDISVLDHLILYKDSYTSMAKESLL